MSVENLSPRFDIFRADPDGPMWRGARQNFEEALKTAIDLTFEERGDCFIADIRTGEQTPVPFLRMRREANAACEGPSS
jgi:hypothetical protein